MRQRWSTGVVCGVGESTWEMISEWTVGSRTGWSFVLPVQVWWTLLFLGYIPSSCWAAVPCWEALLRCQAEPACTGAYEQYQAACSAVLSFEAGSFRRTPLPTRPACPSHCIAALVHLNQTQAGPALEGCQCGRDRQCHQLQAAIEPCLPRTSAAGGCMGARLNCEQEPACRRPLAAYLARCGQLFNGRRCTAACRETIEQLLASAAGPPLQQCVCDGPERPFCEVLKVHMGRLCFGVAGELRPVGGSIEEDEGDYDEDDEGDDEGGEEEGPRREYPRGKARAAQPTVAAHLLVLGVLVVFGL
ncbi:growth arrest-specific protein 1-like [Lissotriton helveticus]